MSSSPTVHSQFTILSGGICFGDLHNIWHGAISDPMERLHFIPPQVSGTVIVHDVNFNIGARNGAWNVYQLVDIDSCSEVVAWFACHVEIDPQAEVDRILHVSGSPYEPDSGSSRNCEKTVDNGILVINRYDWGCYDERALEDVAEWEHIPDGRVLHNPSEGAGLVDSVGAKDQVVQWRTAPSRTRDSLPSPGGTWMHIPDAEYKFGRFGFDATRRTAQSFLFFTGATHFTNTTFTGVHKSLRKLETAEERFERQIREGYNFEGLDTLHLLASCY
ncbi:hypothetical protein MGYG_08584 [Nannizzia gypsea CBS 118893]|uniref:Uncharacterized protein n=1 Tax=Arthroderma gypseum (strain ATCC MYA-4604 / CBS 118893) TaxID=535722 RepID=E4V6E5_ARTGP|nr:hypothetical protein MGYG_08584 [Nannizzia gypsea CBS 118893]EFQ96661.1 hypothetical protein MGYG_08584 [Nannizzia gypsea CBS 118893]